MLFDLRDSGSIEQDADNVFFLHVEKTDYRESAERENDIQFIIAKQRSGERNIARTILFEKDYMRFSDKVKNDLPHDLPKEWTQEHI